MFSRRVSLLLLFPVALLVIVANQSFGFKMHITDVVLDMLKFETKKFVEEEITKVHISDISGEWKKLQYNIADFRITELNLRHVDMKFIDGAGLLFDIQDSSISLKFHGRLRSLVRYTGYINATAEGVNINTNLSLTRGEEGHLKINNFNCKAKFSKIKVKFSDRKLYDVVFRMLRGIVRIFLKRQICPTLEDAALEKVNSMLKTISMRSNISNYIGIDYSLIEDPVVTPRSLDMHFRGMFYDLHHPNNIPVNSAVNPVITQYDRMVYLALSGYFFDSGLFAYYSAGMLEWDITNMMHWIGRGFMRLFGAFRFLRPGLIIRPIALRLALMEPPEISIGKTRVSVKAAVTAKLILPNQDWKRQIIIEITCEATPFIRENYLAAHVELTRFHIAEGLSGVENGILEWLESWFRKNLMNLINKKTESGYPIPAPWGMEFRKAEITYHHGFIVIGTDLHFTKGLGEIIAVTHGNQDIVPTSIQDPDLADDI